MNLPPLHDPILQTIAVGMVVCAIAGTAMLYLWSENRRERFLLYWAIAWLIGVVRWSIHYAGLQDPRVRLVEALLAAIYLLLIMLGAYEVLPRRRWRPSRLAAVIAVLFAAIIAAGTAYDVIYHLFYGTITLVAAFVVWCFWRGYQATGLSGYAIAATAFAAQGTFFGTGIVLWGPALSNMVVGPLLNIPTAASFLLIAYQRSRRELRDAERKLRQIFDTAPIPMVITRAPHGEIEQFNQAAQDLAGLPAAQLTGKTAIEAGIIRDPAARQAMYDALNAGHNVVGVEMPYLRGGSEQRIYAMNASGLDLDDGRRFIFALYDLTELRQAQAALETLNQNLEQQVAERTRDLEAFGFSVSHDLRAPLRHIDGFLSILQENLGDRLEPENQKLVDTAKRAARRMGTLIDDLLRFSHLGSAALVKRPCNLNRMIAETITSLEPETRGRDITWRVDQLPRVEADPSLLQQVLWNLLSNAIKYSHSRTPARIEIGTLPPGGTSGTPVFFVRDNGVGFDPAYAGKLFDVFQRLHPANEFEGTGIGLAIVERIVRKHGGRIWGEGTVDAGATFCFTLGPG